MFIKEMVKRDLIIARKASGEKVFENRSLLNLADKRHNTYNSWNKQLGKFKLNGRYYF